MRNMAVDNIYPIRKELFKEILASTTSRVTLTTDATHASIKRMGYNVLTLVRADSRVFPRSTANLTLPLLC